MKIEGLNELLDSLKDEIESWVLDPAPADPVPIRKGLYLTAMDILLAETRAPGGYAAYAALPDRVLLPEPAYAPIRAQLEPYVTWFGNLWNRHAAQLQAAGLTNEEAFREILISDEPMVNTWLTNLKNF